MKALNYLKGICKEDDIVMLHDAVRPLITDKLINDNIESVKEFGNGITAVPFTETGIISEDKEYTEKTIVRNTLYVAKAPRAFILKMSMRRISQGRQCLTPLRSTLVL